MFPEEIRTDRMQGAGYSRKPPALHGYKLILTQIRSKYNTHSVLPETSGFPAGPPGPEDF